eukprot:4001427-Alexandrium_andersonii.AAC.1
MQRERGVEGCPPRAVGSSQAGLPVLSYRNKLTAGMVKEHFSVGDFTALLVLTDFADTFGAGRARGGELLKR